MMRERCTGSPRARLAGRSQSIFTDTESPPAAVIGIAEPSPARRDGPRRGVVPIAPRQPGVRQLDGLAHLVAVEQAGDLGVRQDEHHVDQAETAADADRVDDRRCRPRRRTSGMARTMLSSNKIRIQRSVARPGRCGVSPTSASAASVRTRCASTSGGIVGQCSAEQRTKFVDGRPRSAAAMDSSSAAVNATSRSDSSSIRSVRQVVDAVGSEATGHRRSRWR